MGRESSVLLGLVSLPAPARYARALCSNKDISDSDMDVSVCSEDHRLWDWEAVGADKAGNPARLKRGPPAGNTTKEGGTNLCPVPVPLVCKLDREATELDEMSSSSSSARLLLLPKSSSPMSTVKDSESPIED